MIAAPPPRWHREADAEPAVVAEMRRGVADFARGHGADEDVVANLTLAVSEAVTNAIIHAFVGRERGRVAITAEAGEGCVLVRVLDDGRGMTPHPDSPGLGLGLTMMASMATRCDIREGAEGVGTEVRLAFDAPGVAGPALGIGEGDDRFELLLAVERIADQAGWPGEGPDQLVALIVPRIADACTIDIVGEDGEPQRLAARYEGPGGPELAAHLASRRPTREQFELTVAELRAGRPRVVSIDTDVAGRDRPRRRGGAPAGHDGPRALGQPAAAGLRPAAGQPRARAVAGARGARGAAPVPAGAGRPRRARLRQHAADLRAAAHAPAARADPRRARRGGHRPRRASARSSTPTRRPRGCSAPRRSRRCWPPSRASSRPAS